MSELYMVRFVSANAEAGNYLAHHGIKGQRWGIRRFQNEDGTYTRDGLMRLQNNVNRAVSVGIRAKNAFNTGRNVTSKVRRVASNPRQAVSNMLRSSKKKTTKAQQKANRERAKKILLAAGAVTVVAAAAYGLHRYNKTSENLSQLAKNKIQADFDRNSKGLTGEALRKAQVAKTKAMIDAEYRSGAKKVLDIRGRRETKHFIKAHGVAKMKLADLVEQRHGPLTKGGVVKSKLTGRLRSETKREIARHRKKVAEQLKHF